MLASTALTFLNLGVFIVSFILIIQVFPIRHWPVARWLILLLVVFCVISFSTLSVYVQEDYNSKIFFSRMRFAGLGFIAPAWLLFLSARFNTWRFLQKPWALGLLLTPGVVTWSLSVLPPYQNYVIHNFNPIEVLGMKLTTYDGGPWFPIHYLWSVFLTCVAFVIGAQVFRNKDRLIRKQVLVLMFGSFLSLSIDVYCVVTRSDWRWAMLPAGTYLFTVVAIAIGIYRYRFLTAILMDMKNVHLHSPDPVLVLDRFGCLLSCNYAAQNIFEINPKNIGRPLNSEFAKRCDQARELEWSDHQQNQRFFEVAQRRIDPDEDLGTCLFFKEITEFKKMKQSLSEDIEFRGRLMALIAHDMFGHVQNQVRLSEALKQRMTSDSDHILETMLKSATESQDLMTNLIEWSKTQSSGFRLSERPFEVNILLQEVAEEVSSLFKSKSVKLDFVSHEHNFVVLGDSQLLGTAVRNLLTNSLRATKSGGEIRITLKSDPQTYLIEVLDSGEGMSPEEVEFLNANSKQKNPVSGKKTERGFGIGFSIVRHFVSLHGGQIEITSQKGRGTTVRLILPLKIPGS